MPSFAQTQAFTVSDRFAFLTLPDNPQPNTPWVWYTITIENSLPAAEEQWMFDQFLQAGIAVAGIDIGESYGSPAGRVIFTDFYDELVNHMSMSATPCFLARSRGGLMAYNWAAEHPECVSGIAGIYPVCNLESYPGLATACGAYDMTEQELRDHLTEHNPIDRLAPLAAADVPLYHLHGDVDTIVPLEQNSAILAEQYEELGGTITLDIKVGHGHDYWEGWFHDEGLTNFVITTATVPEPGSAAVALAAFAAFVAKRKKRSTNTESV